jgi:hypothetical protein
LVFFLLSFGFKVGRLEGRFFFQVIFGVESGLSSVHLNIGHWNSGLSMQVLLGAAGVKGEDLFSFQPIGRAKVPCFYFF